MRSFFKSFCFAIFAIGIFSLFSCNSMVDNNYLTIIDVIKHFDNNGLRAERIYPALAEAIKAEQGCVLELEGQRFEIYKYDLNNPIQKEKLEKIKKNNEIIVVGFKYPVIVNGSFILLNYQGHPKEDEIIRVFKKIGR